MGIDFRRPRHIRGFKLGEVLIFDPGKALVEKTVSGTIAHITDGADNVPTKSLVVTIPPTLSGVSSVTETQTGRNLWNESWETGAISETTGANTTNNNKIRPTGLIAVKPSTSFYIVCPQLIQILFYRKDETYIGIGSGYGSSRVFTTDAETYFIRFNVANAYGNTYNNDISINFPSTDTEYNSHVTPTVSTVNLGRTIYGGTADIVNGVGKDTCTKIKISDLNWTYYKGGTNPIFYAGYVPNMKVYERGEMPNIAIDGYTTRLAQSRSYLSANMANMECSAIETFATIAFRNDSYTSVSDMLTALGNEYIGYEITTSTDFTFDGQEINTRLGYNAFWSDSGDTEVTYYAYAD